MKSRKALDSRDVLLRYLFEGKLFRSLLWWQKYLLKPGMSQNDPKPAKSSRNQPKRPKTNWNDLEKISKRPETTKNFKIGKICNFLLALDFQILSPNAQIWVFWAKKFWLSHLNEILHVPYFECAYFKFVICLWKFRAQMPKFEHFGPKGINFLILTKFCVYPILNVMLSNLSFVFENFEPKYPNLGIFGQKVLAL